MLEQNTNKCKCSKLSKSSQNQQVCYAPPPETCLGSQWSHDDLQVEATARAKKHVRPERKGAGNKYNVPVFADGEVVSDVQERLRQAEKLRDVFGAAKGKGTATVVGAFNKKTGEIAAGASGCGKGKCGEDQATNILGGNTGDLAFTKTGWAKNTAQEIPICEECEGNYGRESFPADARFKSDEAY